MTAVGGVADAAKIMGRSPELSIARASPKSTHDSGDPAGTCPPRFAQLVQRVILAVEQCGWTASADGADDPIHAGRQNRLPSDNLVTARSEPERFP